MKKILVFFIAMQLFMSASAQADSNGWWRNLQEVNLRRISKLDQIIMLARLGATREELSRNVTFSEGTEFQRRRSKQNFFESVFSNAQSSPSKSFWIAVDDYPAVLSGYVFDKGTYSVCPGLRTQYHPRSTAGIPDGVSVRNSEVRMIWPQTYDPRNLSKNNRGCGSAPNKRVIDEFESSFSGSWLGYITALDLPMQDINLAEKLREIADRGDLFFSYECTPAIQPLRGNLVQKKESSTFFCYILSLDLKTRAGELVATWDFDSNTNRYVRQVVFGEAG